MLEAEGGKDNPSGSLVKFVSINTKRRDMVGRGDPSIFF